MKIGDGRGQDKKGWEERRETRDEATGRARFGKEVEKWPCSRRTTRVAAILLAPPARPKSLLLFAVARHARVLRVLTACRASAKRSMEELTEQSARLPKKA